MKNPTRIPCILVAALAALIILPGLGSTARAQGTAFTYQGFLTLNGQLIRTPHDIVIAPYGLVSGGSPLAMPVTNLNVPVANGLFNVTLDFGGIFNGADRWLDISVRPTGSGGAFTNLAPRQPVTPAPYAMFAGGVNAAGVSGPLPSGSLAGTYNGAVSFTNSANSFTGNGAGLTNLNLTGAQLSTNVALRSGGNSFSGNQTFSSGSVGIGAGMPAAPLEVSGGDPRIGVQVMQLSGPAGAMTKYHSTTGGLDWDIYAATNGYAISRSGIDFPFIIDSGSGNIGLGTASPTRLLHLKGAGIGMRFEDTLVANSANNNWTIDTSAFNTGILGILRYESGSAVEAKSFFLNPSGNVGIGLRNPSSRLEVNGTVTATGFSGNGNGLTNLNLKVTNSVFVTPFMFNPSFLTGGAAISTGPSGAPCISFPDGVTSDAQFSVILPDDFNFETHQIKVYYTSTTTSGAFDCSLFSRGTAPGVAMSSSIGGGAFTVPMTSQATASTLGVGVTDFVGQADGNSRVVFCQFRRRGGNDSSTGVLQVYGISVQWTSN